MAAFLLPSCSLHTGTGAAAGFFFSFCHQSNTVGRKWEIGLSLAVCVSMECGSSDLLWGHKEEPRSPRGDTRSKQETTCYRETKKKEEEPISPAGGPRSKRLAIGKHKEERGRAKITSWGPQKERFGEWALFFLSVLHFNKSSKGLASFY